ncbi:hypothetical protein ACFYWS_25990 [Streptomyces sp. NPDC002795]|uniref:hypothetical protein n=1 Tax=Streptomyces sp. NPDC002795 TaxID=3364665 RepID=UPI00369753B6
MRLTRACAVSASCIALVAMTACTSDSGDSPESSPSTKSSSPSEKSPSPSTEESEKSDSETAVFKVSGTAPSGVDITYGSDGTNLGGNTLPFSKTMKVKEDALYYQITAQLQGGGDIKCSVTIGDHTKSGRAQGGYNICSAQLNSGFSGGFS